MTAYGVSRQQRANAVKSVKTFESLLLSYTFEALGSAIHYSDVILSAMASQITSLTIACSTVYSSADQRKHQTSASLTFVWGIHRWPANSPHKGPVTRNMFPFDDVIIIHVDRNSSHRFWMLSRDISKLCNRIDDQNSIQKMWLSLQRVSVKIDSLSVCIITYKLHQYKTNMKWITKSS